MKFLGKLNINSERILKNEELVNLKGGYSGYGGDNGGDGETPGGGDSQSKVDACSGLKEYDNCTYYIGVQKRYGKCGKIAPNYILHCVD